MKTNNENRRGSSASGASRDGNSFEKRDVRSILKGKSGNFHNGLMTTAVTDIQTPVMKETMGSNRVLLTGNLTTEVINPHTEATETPIHITGHIIPTLQTIRQPRKPQFG